MAFVAGSANDQSARAVQAAKPEKVVKFGAFKREQDARDRQQDGLFGGPNAIVDASTLRKLKTKKDVWAATGAQTCVAASGSASSAIVAACVDPGIADTNGVWSVGRPAPSEIRERQLPDQFAEITALLPDGVTAATIDVASGEAVSAQVMDNAFSVSVSSTPLSATWTDANGVRQTLNLAPKE